MREQCKVSEDRIWIASLNYISQGNMEEELQPVPMSFLSMLIEDNNVEQEEERTSTPTISSSYSSDIATSLPVAMPLATSLAAPLLVMPGTKSLSTSLPVPMSRTEEDKLYYQGVGAHLWYIRCYTCGKVISRLREHVNSLMTTLSREYPNLSEEQKRIVLVRNIKGEDIPDYASELSYNRPCPMKLNRYCCITNVIELPRIPIGTAMGIGYSNNIDNRHRTVTSNYDDSSVRMIDEELCTPELSTIRSNVKMRYLAS